MPPRRLGMSRFGTVLPVPRFASANIGVLYSIPTQRQPFRACVACRSTLCREEMWAIADSTMTPMARGALKEEAFEKILKHRSSLYHKHISEDRIVLKC